MNKKVTFQCAIFRFLPLPFFIGNNIGFHELRSSGRSKPAREREGVAFSEILRRRFG